jgi:hypothetical protein
MELQLRDAINHSAYALNLVKAIDKPIIALFEPALPADPQIYFGPGPVTP